MDTATVTLPTTTFPTTPFPTTTLPTTTAPAAAAGYTVHAIPADVCAALRAADDLGVDFKSLEQPG